MIRLSVSGYTLQVRSMKMNSEKDTLANRAHAKLDTSRLLKERELKCLTSYKGRKLEKSPRNTKTLSFMHLRIQFDYHIV